MAIGVRASGRPDLSKYLRGLSHGEMVAYCTGVLSAHGAFEAELLRDADPARPAKIIEIAGLNRCRKCSGPLPLRVKGKPGAPRRHCFACKPSRAVGE
jgi:hypothetical protein